MHYHNCVAPSLTLSLFLLAAAADDSPWIALFDGKSTSAWLEVSGKKFPTSWTVEDGLLRAIPTPGGVQDICTIEEFASFELTLDWKLLDDGNSGIKYLVQKRDEWNNASGRQARARGLEFQLAGPLEPDGKSDPKRASGSLYSVIAPAVAAGPALPDGFHRSRIVVRGSQVEHWTNGVRVLAFDVQSPVVQSALRKLLGAADKPLKTASAVCLQNHSSPAWFREIRIRRLD